MFPYNQYLLKKFPSTDSRKKFTGLLDEALKQKIWTHQLISENKQKEMQDSQNRVTSTGSGFGIGIATITRANDMNMQKNTQEIKGAFSDLESLKQKAKGVVVIANNIKGRIQKKELTNDEMNDIQQVMFNMGMTDGFTSHVTKDISGKKFF